MTRVLPVPAPARTRSGPSVASTASRWRSFRSFRSVMEGWGALKEGILSDLPSISNFRFGRGASSRGELCYNLAICRGNWRRMHPHKLPVWLQRLVATMGGGGLFAVAFLDSSVLSFPFVTDALVIELSIARPARMPYYAAMAPLGSLAGCIWLYLLAKKGGEAFFHRRAGKGSYKAKRWVQQRGFLSVFIPAIL